jgi:hypothetical protein
MTWPPVGGYQCYAFFHLSFTFRPLQKIDQSCFQHRSATTDYDIFFHGSVVLITPDEAYDPKTGKGKLRETICHPGDVVMQRGALHA